ncbi:hypothetical protein RO3G_01174 [Rhizopus delemar RA 99-880]|uniref:Histone deacetylase interacting domain-containing protein n=1 Tax=Rhizopus delemar (strain RA 99-880 / ATCC MYA-4621 / FGSC 9543 / NRRL 43880) TaxID=246409 RepID=I1BJU0_RHIO9|nr:hypothetical protein RO3G_01174 [Rhizopus delemar RA 99-880]|eukprot:EIE76470.1 hypothetical protein RO3G_01174 [Rhizopus delemar RA 99-880]
MSSPNQPPPPPIIRSPTSTSQSLSPYSHHLPPPNLQSNNAGPLPLRVTELPSIISPPRNSASPSNFVQHANLPPPTSFPTEPAVLPPPSPPPPPILPSRTPPFTEHRPNVPHAPPPSASQPQPATESSQNGYRPLNVRDALTYLDQVKIRFSDKPDVYNQFLDIMKDFKSQAIDTPGVIDRVSTLFKGHPTLISGFNTFLPPGYRIECSAREPDLITVTTPSGVTTTTGRRSDHVPYYPYIHPPPPPPPPPHPSQIPSYRPHHHPSYPPIPTSHSPLAGHHDEDDESPLEFNHAINYVNRIKNRYAHDPDVYKQFLEILQTYQKDNKPIQEVYAHVQYLFQGEPDLLEEFKQFLPDITGQPLYDSTSHTSGLKRTANSSIKKKRAHYKRTKYKSEDSFNFTNNFDLSKPSVSAEEIELFERIRKHIGNKPSYEEFLKTLNLYTQHIVDMNTLIDQVSIFIGNNSELMDWFKSMIGYESKEHDIERPTHTIPKPDLNTCQTTGNPHESPSYRVVPKDWQNQPCSGRDQLCWEVLNDEYVSHPIWASEEDGFVASRKSQYEEAMHRCEEERYEYNMIIDANLNVISLMEPITQSIEQMTPEEKESFRLKPGLGGESVTIYERIIKKIYDKERGMEIIDLLYSSPAYVIPVVLRRLKQKDEEWKRAQREWNKIWRELDAKNFYRALDYQGITFKSNDRKAMAPKALVSEIEHMLQQQKKKKVQGHQFKYDLADQDVFKDVTRVIYSFIDRQTGYSNSDRERVRFFIQTFIPLCFHVVSDDDSHSMQYKHEEEDEEDNHFTHTEEEGSETPKRVISKNNKRENDHIMELLRDVLTNKGHEVNEQVEQDENSLLAAAAAVSAPIKKQNKFSFFCNTSFYCFFRLYQMLYERLEKLKVINDKMTKDPRSGKRTNRTATNLGLYSTRFDGLLSRKPVDAVTYQFH